MSAPSTPRKGTQVSSVSGYISNLTPCKQSRDGKKRYFNFTFQSETGENQGVCFSPEKHKLFRSIAEDQNENVGVELKKYQDG